VKLRSFSASDSEVVDRLEYTLNQAILKLFMRDSESLSILAIVCLSCTGPWKQSLQTLGAIAMGSVRMKPLTRGVILD
jgi:hypothetical protein